IWNGTGWDEDEKIEYILDSNFNRTKETSMYGGNTYVEDYVYDTTQLMSNFAHPFKDKTGLEYILEDNPFYNKILSYSGNNSRTTANYDSQIVLGVDELNIAKNEIKVIINPISSDVTIK